MAASWHTSQLFTAFFYGVLQYERQAWSLKLTCYTCNLCNILCWFFHCIPWCVCQSSADLWCPSVGGRCCGLFWQCSARSISSHFIVKDRIVLTVKVLKKPNPFCRIICWLSYGSRHSAHDEQSNRWGGIVRHSPTEQYQRCIRSHKRNDVRYGNKDHPSLFPIRGRHSSNGNLFIVMSKGKLRGISCQINEV